MAKGDREKEIDLRGFEVMLTGLDDELVRWWQGTLCQWWQVELELPVAYANTDVQGSLIYRTLICRRWFRGPVIGFRITCSVEKGETMKIGAIIQEDLVGTYIEKCPFWKTNFYWRF